MQKSLVTAVVLLTCTASYAEDATCDGLRQQMQWVEQQQKQPQPGQRQDDLNAQHKQLEWAMQKARCETIGKKRFSMGN